MSYDSSITFSISTQSETGLYSSAEILTGEQYSASDLTVNFTTATQTPGGPLGQDPMEVYVSALGDAFGTDTLTIASVSGGAIDNGTTAIVDLDVSALAIAESEEYPTTVAYTDAHIQDVTVSYTSTIASSTTQGGPEGGSALASSQTTLFALEVDSSDFGEITGNSDFEDLAGSNDLGMAPPSEPDQLEGGSSSYDYDHIDIAGNTAIVDIDVTIMADDTYLQADAMAFTLADELSSSTAFVDFALSG